MVCCHLIVSCPTVVDSPLWFPLNSINSPIYINLWQIPSSRQLSPSDTRNSAKTPGKLVAASTSDDLRTSHLRNVCHHQDLDISGFPSKLGKLMETGEICFFSLTIQWTGSATSPWNHLRDFSAIIKKHNVTSATSQGSMRPPPNFISRIIMNHNWERDCNCIHKANGWNHLRVKGPKLRMQSAPRTARQLGNGDCRHGGKRLIPAPHRSADCPTPVAAQDANRSMIQYKPRTVVLEGM